VWILESARRALIQAGITKWSFKATRYLRRVEEISKRKSDDRSNFLKPVEVAERLHVSQGSVRSWCKLGYVRHMRVCRTSSSKRHYSYVVPEKEVSLLEEKELKNGADVKDKSVPSEEGLGEKWLTMKETAHLLGCAVSTVSMRCKDGGIKFVPFSTLGGKKKYLIPTSEVERLAKSHERSVD
jgi:excisionase family DNA binding protein